jgi:6-phospho-beta-glucosidase
MKLALLGGGGFRVPLVSRALIGDSGSPIDALWLYDSSAERLAAIGHVITRLLPATTHLRVHSTTSLEEAVAGADFVFSAIRVGGLPGRIADERAALALGVLGQETIGPGGIAYALRTIPVALRIAHTIRRLAPDAFVINFTNPAGVVTEAMQRVLGDQVIGICDTPSGLGKRVAALMGVPAGLVSLDYVGLNHLGWLRRAMYGTRDLVAELLVDDERLSGLEEAQVFGVEWLRTLGMVPNEYLYYFYYNRESVHAISRSEQTRGEFLAEQQGQFYADVQASPADAVGLWQRAHDERESTYMREARGQDEARPDVSAGGYERVALDLMSAIAKNESRTMILNVRNRFVLPGLPETAVIEVPSLVDGSGVHPLATPPPPLAELGLMQQVKAVEQLTIRAVVENDPSLALRAIATHPLVSSVSIARQLLATYRQNTPDLFRLASGVVTGMG